MTNSVRTAFDEEDRRKIIQLLQEYSGKLRALCDNVMTARARRTQMIATTFLSSLLAFVASVVSFQGLSEKLMSVANDGTPLIMVTVFLFVLVVAIALVFMTQIRIKWQYDIHEVAAILRKLLQAVSQYNEHKGGSSGYLLAERFEIDIRLAEAEASLKLYEDLLDRPDTITSALRRIIN